MPEKHEDTDWLFGGERSEGGEWEAQRRFISDKFNPIYRQGVIGPYHLPEGKFSEFLAVAKAAPQAGADQIRTWIKTARPHGGDFGDLAMERIAARAPSLDADTAFGLVRVFAEVMDDYYRIRPKREMFFDIWEQSEGILRTFSASVLDYQLDQISDGIAKDGSALSWMISSIGRTELWAHGLTGDQRKDPDRHQLSENALRSFLSALFRRLSALPTEEIFGLPSVGRALFCLKESPWHKELAAQVFRRLAGSRTSDETFIAFLEAMAGPVISSARGVYYTISIPALRTLLGEEMFERRWARLQAKALAPDLASRLANIRRMMAEAKNW